MDIDKLIVDNMGLVYKQLHKLFCANDDEAYSCGVEALINAARTYSSDKGVKFSTYASVCIYNGIAHYLRGLQRKRKLEIVYYADTIDSESNITYEDVLQSDEMPSDNYLLQERNEYIWKAFNYVYEDLQNDVARCIIRMWKESDFTITQSELAIATGVSQAHVSRTLSAFKHKLKKELEDYLCEK